MLLSQSRVPVHFSARFPIPEQLRQYRHPHRDQCVGKKRLKGVIDRADNACSTWAGTAYSGRQMETRKI